MGLPTSPPIYRTWADLLRPIKVGEGPSWRVYALQRALIARGHEIQDDGVYSPNGLTYKAVRSFQRNNALVPDGIVGILTQRKLIWKVSKRLDAPIVATDLTAAAIAYGISVRETSGTLAPTNDRDPSPSDIGTDIGPMQLRVQGPPYNVADLRVGFDTLKSMDRSLWSEEKGLVPRVKRLRSEQPGLTQMEVLRASILAHNAPFLYEQFCDLGHLRTPDAPTTWITLPDGTHPTHAEHLADYAGDVIGYARSH